MRRTISVNKIEKKTDNALTKQKRKTTEYIDHEIWKFINAIA